MPYWVKYQIRTNRPFLNRDGTELTRYLSDTAKDDFLPLREQKELVDTWFETNKEPDYSPLTLDVASAPKVFDKIKTVLTRVRGAAGIPLAYVIRHQLEPPDWDDDPPFGEEGSEYPSYDEEMIARAPILTPGRLLDEAAALSPGNETLLAAIDQEAPLRLQQQVWHAAGPCSELNRELAYDWRFTLAESDLPKVRSSTQLAGPSPR